MSNWRRGHRRSPAEIASAVWRQAERDFVAHIPYCERRGHPDRAAAWREGAERCRARWQEAEQQMKREAHP